jgi:hypothetical protein
VPRDSELFALKHERYLCAAYAPLVKAAGYLPEYAAQLSGTEMYFLATAVQSAVKSRARVITKGAFSETDFLGALREMSARELREMRTRLDCKLLSKRCK